MMFGLLLGYLPGWKGAYAAWQSFKTHKAFRDVPYDRLLSFAKNAKKAGAAGLNTHLAKEVDTPSGEIHSIASLSPDELQFYAFMMHPKIRKGFRALIACGALCLLIAGGADWLILYLITAVFFLLGVGRVTQGVMDVV